MHRSVCSRLFVRKAAVAVGVLALGMTVLAPAQAVVPPNWATINTHKAWNGSTEIIPFGCPDTTTYGQLITIPPGKTRLKHFVFYLANNSGSGSMVVRGEAYAWDGSKATGTAIYESAPRTIAYADSTFHREAFQVRGAAVTPGAQYVIFASIDKDYEQCTGNYLLGWGAVPGSTYKGGWFVFQNNAGHEEEWTTSAWDTYHDFDLAVRVFLG